MRVQRHILISVLALASRLLGLYSLPGRPRSLERSDRARVLNAHAHVYKYTHAHWSTTTGPYHYGSAQDTISSTGSGVY